MQLIPDVDDAPGFLSRVQAVTDGLLRSLRPSSIVVIKIDNFFSSKWLRFSGKSLGAIGVWKERLNIPPFVPDRVLSQRAYAGVLYDELISVRPLHVHTESVTALLRYTADIAKGAAIIWYSGRSLKSGQGAMMAHFPTIEGYWPIYVRWNNRGSWKVVESHEISVEEIRRLTEASFALTSGTGLRRSFTM